ncbi:MAG: AgmX/PglI C-terminal domain-containing protein [Bdellovibrionales bacterium]|nr:AgmX/PglI C-terminal domain-containing protein [Bdellovibrionales bacterium]
MIQISNADQKLIKTLPQGFAGILGHHPKFGFVSEQAHQSRIEQRRRQGFPDRPLPEWNFQFQVSDSGTVSAVRGCEVTKAGDQRWNLRTPQGEFVISTDQSAALAFATVAPQPENTLDRVTRWIPLLALLFLLVFVGLVGTRMMTPSENTAAKADSTVETVHVEIPKELLKPQAIAVQEEAIPTEVKNNPDAKAHKALPKALGFLGLLGSKELKKAVGGAPLVPGASPGAGSGGTEGSGGEMLTGIGQGVKRTTVGNSGVAGLGGVGTKGKGGGGGGYGTALIGSGNGKGLTSMPTADEVVLDGGLDKGVILATIAKHLDEVRACYERGLEAHPGLEGQIDTTFEISGTGKLNYARVTRSTLGSPQVEQCIVQRMLTWNFPKPVGGVNMKVNYPFMLRPVGT